MSDLRAGWEGVAARLSQAPHVLILLDYDGTLVPIAERPELARLSAGGRRALVILRDLPGVSVGVVSGRGLDDLVSHVSVNGLWYVGNHGYEHRKVVTLLLRRLPERDRKEVEHELRTLNLIDVVL